MVSDPYKALGISPTASDGEVIAAYRKLAKKYHPDVNPGDEDATRKMSEINAAYEQIKSGKAAQNSGSQSSSYGSSNGGNNHGENGPFGGFGFYSNNRQQGHENSEFNPVRNYLRAGYYDEALNVLNNINNKNAEWYYYSAIANSGAGNKITALNHAKIAVQMEPNNAEYQRVLNQIQSGGRTYQQQSQDFGMPIINISNLCLGTCIANMLCNFCL
ncbi:MAG: J domain-containing protein [Mobilitalea sp.]